MQKLVIALKLVCVTKEINSIERIILLCDYTHIKHKHLPIFIACLTLLSTAVHATSYATPKKRDVFSPEKKHQLVVDPKTQTHQVYAVGSDKAIWSFKHSVWHQPFMLANGGKTAVVLAWRYVQEHGDGEL